MAGEGSTANTLRTELRPAAGSHQGDMCAGYKAKLASIDCKHFAFGEGEWLLLCIATLRCALPCWHVDLPPCCAGDPASHHLVLRSAVLQLFTISSACSWLPCTSCLHGASPESRQPCPSSMHAMSHRLLSTCWQRGRGDGGGE